MRVKTYDEYVALVKRGRGGKKKVALGAYAFQEKDAIRLEVWGIATCRLTPDGVFTLIADVSDMYSIATTSKTAYFINGLWWHGPLHMWLDASHHRGKKVTSRVVMGDLDLPYTPGLCISHNHPNKIINPEIAVDEVKVLDKTAALEIKRRMAKLAKLTKAMHRLGIPVDLNRKDRWHVRSAFRVEDINVDDPTAEDAERVLALGAAHTDWWNWSGTTAEDRLRAEKRAVKNGLAKVRELLYKQAGLYSYQPKTD